MLVDRAQKRRTLDSLRREQNWLVDQLAMPRDGRNLKRVTALGFRHLEADRLVSAIASCNATKPADKLNGEHGRRPDRRC